MLVGAENNKTFSDVKVNVLKQPKSGFNENKHISTTTKGYKKNSLLE